MFIAQLKENEKKLDGISLGDFSPEFYSHCTLNQAANHGDINLMITIAKNAMVPIVEDLVVEWNSKSDCSISSLKLLRTPELKDLSDFRSFNITQH